MYLTDYQTRRAVPTDVMIELSGEHVSGQTYRISGRLSLEPEGESKWVRVYMVQVLDYWPPESDCQRNVFKQAAETQDLYLIPEVWQTVEREFTFDEDSWANQEDITIVVWVQEPNDVWPAEVYQAAMIDWPLECVGDLDGDGDTDHADLGILMADWGCYDPVNGCVGDLDGDDDTDHADLGVLLGDWGCDVTPY